MEQAAGFWPSGGGARVALAVTLAAHQNIRRQCLPGAHLATNMRNVMNGGAAHPQLRVKSADRELTFIRFFCVCVKSENYESSAVMMGRIADNLSICRAFLQKPP